MDFIDQFVVQIDGTIEEVEEAITMTFSAPVSMRAQIGAFAETTGKSKSFIIRGLLNAAISEVLCRLDDDLRARYNALFEKHARLLCQPADSKE